jgi:putative ABC transport system permease protein
MSAIMSQLAREFPEANKGWDVRVIPVRDWIVDAEVAQRLRITLAAVSLLLLVAATNVANLQIARLSGRVREMSIRLALGASRARLVRQMVTENLLLATAGGILGLGLAVFGVRGAAAFLPESLPRRGALSLDVPVVLVAALCIGATALIAGLLPAGVAVRSSMRDALQHVGAPRRRVEVAFATPSSPPSWRWRPLRGRRGPADAEPVRLQQVPLGLWIRTTR